MGEPKDRQFAPSAGPRRLSSFFGWVEFSINNANGVEVQSPGVGIPRNQDGWTKIGYGVARCGLCPVGKSLPRVRCATLGFGLQPPCGWNSSQHEMTFPRTLTQSFLEAHDAEREHDETADCQS